MYSTFLDLLEMFWRSWNMGPSILSNSRLLASHTDYFHQMLHPPHQNKAIECTKGFQTMMNNFFANSLPRNGTFLNSSNVRRWMVHQTSRILHIKSRNIVRRVTSFLINLVENEFMWFLKKTLPWNWFGRLI